MSSRRIPDPGSLIAGITFAGIGLIFLVGNVNLADRARWVWPIVLVGLGAGLLAAVLRRTTEPVTDGPAESTAVEAPAVEPGPAEDTAVEHTVVEEGEARGEPGGDAAVEAAAAEPGPARDAGAADDDAPEAGTAEDTPAGEAPRRRLPPG